jgi:hypothetical protein
LKNKQAEDCSDGTTFPHPPNEPTPAALENERFGTANGVISSATDNVQRKSGGRKPAVANETPLQNTSAHLQRLVRVQHKSGWRKPAVAPHPHVRRKTYSIRKSRSPLQVRIRTTAG